MAIKWDVSMNSDSIYQLLLQVKSGQITPDKALEQLKDLPFKDLDFAKIDTHRYLRIGYPEVIYCAGKTIEQVVSIVNYKMVRQIDVMATRADQNVYEAIKIIAPSAIYHPVARIITIPLQHGRKINDSVILVITAGTSDIPVAEEAAVTASFFGNTVEKIFDVGVAGIHRLFMHLDRLRGAKVIVAVAGMEGALPGIIAGLVDKPVIAVPTSVGYGSNFEGLSALLTMLNTCAPGVSVVNIDNGFGAGYLASVLNGMH